MTVPLELLKRRIAKLSNPEWYVELFAIALEESKNDVSKAFIIADGAYKEMPSPPAEALRAGGDKVGQIHAMLRESPFLIHHAKCMEWLKKCQEGVNKGKPGPCPKGLQGPPRPDKPKVGKPVANQPTPKVGKPKPPMVKPKKTPKLTKEQQEQQAQADREDYKKNGIRAKSFKNWFGDWEHDTPNASKVVDPKTGEPQQTGPVTASKVRDENGQAKIVYHGTPFAAFDKFLKSKQAPGNELLYGPGFYFTDSPEIVADYEARGSGLVKGPTPGTQGHIFKVFLNIRKPFDQDKDKIPLDKLPPNIRNKYARIKEASINGKSTEDLPYDQREEIRKVLNRYIPPNELGFSFDEVLNRYSWKKEIKRDLARIGFNLEYKPPSGISWKELTLKRDRMSKVQANQLLAKLGYDGITHIGHYGARAGAKVAGVVTHRVWIAFDPKQIKSVDNEGTFDPKSAKINKDLEEYNIKEGFTGKKRDKLSHEQCYADGVHVPCGQEQAGTSEQKPQREPVNKPEVSPGKIGSFTKPLEDSTVRDSNTNPSIKDLGPEFTEQQKQYDDNSKKAMLFYGEGAYEKINAPLRAGRTPFWKRATYKAMIRAFDSIKPFSKPITTWRGCSLPKNVAAKIKSAYEQSMKSGEPVQMDSFFSTSMAPHTALNFAQTVAYEKTSVMWEITSTKGLAMEPLNGKHSVEKELVLDHRAKYRVKGIKTVEFEDRGKKTKQEVFQLEQIPDNETPKKSYGLEYLVKELDDSKPNSDANKFVTTDVGEMRFYKNGKPYKFDENGREYPAEEFREETEQEAGPQK